MLLGAGSRACAEGCAQAVSTEVTPADFYSVAASSDIPQQQSVGLLPRTKHGVNSSGAMTVHIAAGAGIAPADSTTSGKLQVTYHLSVWRLLAEIW